MRGVMFLGHDSHGLLIISIHAPCVESDLATQAGNCSAGYVFPICVPASGTVIWCYIHASWLPTICIPTKVGIFLIRYCSALGRSNLICNLQQEKLRDPCLVLISDRRNFQECGEKPWNVSPTQLTRYFRVKQRGSIPRQSPTGEILRIHSRMIENASRISLRPDPIRRCVSNGLMPQLAAISEMQFFF